MKKICLAITILLILLFTFCACGQKDNAPSAETSTTHTCTPGRTETCVLEEATCQWEGVCDVSTYCSECDAYMYSETVYTDLAPHTPKTTHKEYYWHSNCITEGLYYEVVHCSVCDELLFEGEKTDPINEDDHGYISEREVNRVNPTCTEDGSYDLVTYCSDCGKEFERFARTIPALGHTAAAAVEEIITAPTCYSEGALALVVYCSVEGCGAEISRDTQTMPKLQHTPAEAVEENRIDQTHEADGSYELVVYCSVAECHAELERTKYVLDALVHHPASAVKENVVAATCTKEGSYDEVIYCLDEDCGHKELSRRTVTVRTIPHTELEAVKEKEVAVSCTQTGYYENVVYCADCGGELSRAQVIVEKLPHTELEAVKENEIAVSCTQEGYYEDVVYCADCGGELSRTPVTIEKLPHTELEAVKENEIAVSCTQDGYYEDVVYCADCGGELSRTPVTITQLPHTEMEAVREDILFASCDSNGMYDMVVYCSVCSNEVSRQGYLEDAWGHNYVDDVCTVCQWIRPSEGLSYTLSSDMTYYIVSGGNCTDSHVVIPPKYNKLPVGKIANSAFTSRSNLLSIHIPDSVFSIGENAFYDCNNLTSIHIPNSVTSIGSRAFYECTGLAEVIIGDGLTTVDVETFYKCTNLASLTIGNGVTTIGSKAFYQCKKLTSVVVGDSVTTIEADAFDYCTSLFSVTLPEGLTSIGNGTFDDCYKLVEIVNNSSVDIVVGSGIGQYAIEVHTGESRLDQLGDYYFYTYNGVHYLVGYAGEDTDLVFPETYRGGDYVINQYAFYQASVTSVVMFDCVTRIDNNAFSGCAELASIVMSNNVTAIGSYAFWNCNRITSIMIPSSVMEIGHSAFGGCDNLAFNLFDYAYYLGNDSNPYHALITYKNSRESYEVHEDAVVIAGRAFMNLQVIQTIVIPDSVKTIGAAAFSGCTRVLTDLTIGSGVTKIGADAFKDCKVANLYISDLTKWCAIAFGNENSSPLSASHYEHNLYLNGELVTDLVIPDEVTKISSYSFYGCYSIKSVTIGENVTEIGEWAFTIAPYLEVIHYNAVSATFVGNDRYPFEHTGSRITINIGSDVTEIPAYMFANATLGSVIFAEDSVCTKIGDGAFLGCYGLTTFTPPCDIVEIGAGAFDGCESVLVKYDNAEYLVTTTNSHYALLKVLNKDVRSCVIHPNTRLIANAAFEGCELMVEITIPDKVLYLGADAFKDCIRLQEVVLSENLVRIGENAFGGCPIASVEFKNPNGWQAGETEIPADTLASTDSAAAAVSTYSDLVWVCSVAPKADSDLDGLFDEEELTLGTDPNNPDTDGDGICDSNEVGLGLDPSNSDLDNYSRVEVTDPEILDDKATPDTVKPIINITINPSKLNSLVIKRTDLVDASTPGYIGDAYQYSISDSFGSATIGFEFDPSKLPADAEPTIYTYNAYYGELKPLTTTISGNRATAVVTSFSTYVLLNRKVMEETLTWEDTWKLETDIYSSVEVVFVIDDSGSMETNDPNNLRLTVAQSLIDKLPQGCKIGIVRFDDSSSKLTSSLTTSKATAKKYLTTSNFNSNGSTYLYEGVKDATTLFSTPKTGDGVMRIMIVLSDGEPTSTSNKSDCVTAAKAKSIAIYTVGLGSNDGGKYFTEHLMPLSNQTNGKFLYSGNADALLSVFDDLGDKIDFSVDSDGDGIPDYYEDHMVSFGGYTFKLDKYKADTDGDGLLDGEEIKIIFQYSTDGEQVTILGKVISNPELKDSDWDGYSDSIDGWPLDSRYH